MIITKNYCIAFVVISSLFFLIGFIHQILFSFHNQHNIKDAHQSKLKSIASKSNKLERSDFQRLNEIELKFAEQNTVIEKLKQLLSTNSSKNNYRSSEEVTKLPENNGNNNTIKKKQQIILTDVTTTVDNNTVVISNSKAVPDIVKSWRLAKLDWHFLLPKHNSIWERYGTPVKGKGLQLLVNKEIEVTNYLTQYHQSGLSIKYGHNSGVLKEYAVCNTFLSVCMIHGIHDCIVDELCSWSQTTQICLDKNTEPSQHKTPEKTCNQPKMITSNGLLSNINDISQCKIYVHQPAVFISIDSESQSMFYHWWASWSTILDHWKFELKLSRNIHYFINIINDSMFYEFFGLITNNCWRRSTSEFQQIPIGTCFCNTFEFSSSQSRTNLNEASTQMINYLSLQPIIPPLKNIKIGLISRRLKRFILNEYELIEYIQKLGYEYVLLPLEKMTLYEQMRELRSLDIMIGMHGSALDNSVFLHKGSVMVQILPYKVEHRCTFESTARDAGVIYQEWQLKDKTKAVFHWDLYEQANKEKLQSTTREKILEEGQVAASSRETLMFWINQDIIVPLEEWKKIIKNAVSAINKKF